jgi:hypothetical protein
VLEKELETDVWFSLMMFARLQGILKRGKEGRANAGST